MRFLSFVVRAWSAQPRTARGSWPSLGKGLLGTPQTLTDLTCLFEFCWQDIMRCHKCYCLCMSCPCGQLLVLMARLGCQGCFQLSPFLSLPLDVTRYCPSLYPKMGGRSHRNMCCSCFWCHSGACWMLSHQPALQNSGQICFHCSK